MNYTPCDKNLIVHSKDEVLTKKVLDNTIFLKTIGFISNKLLSLQDHLNNASYLKITSKNIPDVYNLVEEISNYSGVHAPSIYISNNYEPIARIFGDEKRSFILISSGLLNNASKDELKFIIGHEVGHLFFKHGTIVTILNAFIDQTWNFSQILNLKSYLNLSSASMTFINISLKSLFFVLKQWEKFADISCDRYGYLTTNNIDVARKALFKLKIGMSFNVNYDIGDCIDQYVENLSNASTKFFLQNNKDRTIHPDIFKRMIAVDMFHFNKSKNILSKQELDDKTAIAFDIPTIIRSADEKFEEILLKSMIIVAFSDNDYSKKELNIVESYLKEYEVSSDLRAKLAKFIKTKPTFDGLINDCKFTPAQKELYLDSLYAMASADKKYTNTEDLIITKLLQKFNFSEQEIIQVRNKLLKKFGLTSG